MHNRENVTGTFKCILGMRNATLYSLIKVLMPKS